MKKIVFILICHMLINCSHNYGFIYDDITKKPLKGVNVIDIQDVSNNITTKSDGKFSFSECGDLIIKKNGYKTDTLQKYGCKPKGKCFNGHIFYMKKKND